MSHCLRLIIDKIMVVIGFLYLAVVLLNLDVVKVKSCQVILASGIGVHGTFLIRIVGIPFHSIHCRSRAATNRPVIVRVVILLRLVLIVQVVDLEASERCRDISSAHALLH
jgi:hypothetical protein